MPFEPSKIAGENIIKGITADVYSGIKKWFATLDPSGSKLSDYHAGLLNSFGHIQIMGMTSAQKLENIYVGIRAVPNQKKYSRQITEYYKWKEEEKIVAARKFSYTRERFSIEKFISDLGYGDIAEEPEFVSTSKEEDSAPEGHIQENEINPTVTRSTQAIELVKEHKRLFVLGHPGSGKTTLLKYLALVYAGHLPAKSKIDFKLPIYIPLREIKRTGDVIPSAEWLRDLAISCASDICSALFSKEWLEETLRKGKCIILIDGVDEAPTNQISAIFQSIKAFSTKYRNNSIIITCRVAAFDRSIEGFQICEIDDFDYNDTSVFVNQWYGENSIEAARLLEDINRSALAHDLCRTPLLLTLICVLYGYRRTIPANRAELYEACVDALLFRWDTFRSVDRDPLISIAISPERKKQILSRIAHRAFARNVIYFKKDNLIELFNAELKYLDLNEVPAEILLKEIESHSGLLVEYATSVYCFSHLTFHEFFTALHYHESKDYAELFNKTVSEARYMEVFLMCIEKLYNADELMMQLISHVKNGVLKHNIYSEYLQTLIQNVLACNVIMNRKLRAVLEEIDIELDQLDAGDTSVRKKS